MIDRPTAALTRLRRDTFALAKPGGPQLGLNALFYRVFHPGNTTETLSFWSICRIDNNGTDDRFADVTSKQHNEQRNAKMLTINLETIKSEIRVTARHRGTTLVYRDGQVGSEKELIAAVMADACGSHRKGDGSFDMTYITLNNAAAKAAA